MVDIKALSESSKTLQFDNGIEFEVLTNISIKKQQELLNLYNKSKDTKDETDLSIEMSFGLIKSWNLSNDGEPVALDIEVFKSLPLNFQDLNKIISESGILRMSLDNQKKNIGEI